MSSGLLQVFVELRNLHGTSNYVLCWIHGVRLFWFRCLQHRAKIISSDTDAYQEEMISLRYNLPRNNYPECITSAPRNLYRRIEDNTQKLTTVCLPYVKGLAERIQKTCSPYDIRTVFTSGSTLRRYLFRVKPPTEFNMTKNGVYSITRLENWCTTATTKLNSIHLNWRLDFHSY